MRKAERKGRAIVNVPVPKALLERMRRLKATSPIGLNWSHVARVAFLEVCERMEREQHDSPRS